MVHKLVKIAVERRERGKRTKLRKDTLRKERRRRREKGRERE